MASRAVQRSEVASAAWRRSSSPCCSGTGQCSTGGGLGDAGLPVRLRSGRRPEGQTGSPTGVTCDTETAKLLCDATTSVQDFWTDEAAQLARHRVPADPDGVLQRRHPDRVRRRRRRRPAPSTAPPTSSVYFDLDFLEQLQSSSAPRATSPPRTSPPTSTGTTSRTCSGSAARSREAHATPAQPGQRAVHPARAAGRLLRRRLGRQRHRTSSTRVTSRRASGPRPPWATTGSRWRPRAAPTPRPGTTAARPTASAGSASASRAATRTPATPSPRRPDRVHHLTVLLAAQRRIVLRCRPARVPGSATARRLAAVAEPADELDHGGHRRGRSRRRRGRRACGCRRRSCRRRSRAARRSTAHTTAAKSDEAQEPAEGLAGQPRRERHDRATAGDEAGGHQQHAAADLQLAAGPLQPGLGLRAC